MVTTGECSMVMFDYGLNKVRDCFSIPARGTLLTPAFPCPQKTDMPREMEVALKKRMGKLC